MTERQQVTIARLKDRIEALQTAFNAICKVASKLESREAAHISEIQRLTAEVIGLREIVRGLATQQMEAE